MKLLTITNMDDQSFVSGAYILTFNEATVFFCDLLPLTKDTKFCLFTDRKVMRTDGKIKQAYLVIKYILLLLLAREL